MNTLSNELKAVIGRRLELADSREVLAIASALCGDDAAETMANTAARETPRFDVYVASGTVLDNSTGLMWSRAPLTERLSWKDAAEACGKVDLGGYTDWRLPTIRELLTLVDYERHDPAIDTDVFKCESGWYWTSTACAPSPGDCAWFVYFGYGYADWSNRDNEGFVRAVRASQ